MAEKALIAVGGVAILAAALLYGIPRWSGGSDANSEPSPVAPALPSPPSLPATPLPEAPGAFEAMRLAENGRGDEGLARIRASIGEHGETPMNRTALGFVHLYRSEPEEAGEAFDAVLAKSPDFPFALAGRGILRMGEHRFREAAADLGRVVTLEPGQAEWRRAWATALLGCGRVDEALRAAREAAETDPNASTLTTLGDCLLRAGREAEALDVYERIQGDASSDEAQVRERLSAFGVSR